MRVAQGRPRSLALDSDHPPPSQDSRVKQLDGHVAVWYGETIMAANCRRQSQQHWRNDSERDCALDKPHGNQRRVQHVQWNAAKQHVNADPSVFVRLSRQLLLWPVAKL